MTDSRLFGRYFPLLSLSLIACYLGVGAPPVAADPPNTTKPSQATGASSGDGGDNSMSLLLGADPSHPPVRVEAAAPPAWYALFNQAIATSKAGKRAEAERMYRKLLKAQPAIPEAWANLGILEAQDHHNEAAIADTEKAASLSTDPHTRATLLMQVMQLNARSDNWAACAVAARRAIAATPDGSPPNTLANTYLGISYLHTGRFTDAITPLRKRGLLLGEPAPAGDLRLIFALQRAGRLDEAFDTAQQLAIRLPKDVSAQEALGDSAVALRRFNIALNAYGAAYNIRPDARAGQNAVASAMQLGRNDLALKMLRVMLKRSPDDPKINFALGQLFFFEPASTVAQYEEAEKNLRLAATADPRGPSYVSLLGHSILMQKKPERFAEAGRLFSSALALDPHDDFARLGLAYLAEQQVQFDKDNAPEHYDEAIKQYKAIVAENRHNYDESRARRRLAGIYLTLNKKDEGYREFEALVTRFPNDATDMNELATIYLGDARYKDAEKTYRRLIAAAPQNPEGMVGLGQTLERLKDPTGAKVQYEAALKVDPGNGTAAFCLGNLLKSEKNDEEAMAVYASAVKANPNNNQLHLQLGSDYEQKGRIDDALKEYQALTIKNDDPNRLVYLLMGPSLLIAHGRATEAEKMLTEMYTERPKEDGIAYKLATAQERAGHPALAEATLRKLVEKHSDKPAETITPRVEFAELLERLHRPDEAASLFEDALRVDLTNSSALTGLSRVRSGQQHPEAAGTFLESVALGEQTAPNMTAVNIAQHLYEAMDRTPERYASLLQRLTDKYPNDHALAMRRVAFLLDLEGIHKAENRAAAEKLLQPMILKAPDEADLHYRLGTIREEDGRKADAVAEYTLAVTHNYSYTQAIVALHRLGAAVPVPPASAPLPQAQKPAVATLPASTPKTGAEGGGASPTAVPPPAGLKDQQRP